jgi:uncharacterized protein YxjI
MALCIRERIFSWSQNYDVTDENQKPRYRVKTDFWALTHKIHVYDEKGVEVAYIHEHLWSFLRKYDVYIQGQLKGVIKEKFSWFHPSYEIDFMQAKLTGDIFEWNYQVVKGDEILATMNRKILSWANVYYLEVPDAANELPILALSLAVDAAHHDDEDASVAYIASYPY